MLACAAKLPLTCVVFDLMSFTANYSTIPQALSRETKEKKKSQDRHYSYEKTQGVVTRQTHCNDGNAQACTLESYLRWSDPLLI